MKGPKSRCLGCNSRIQFGTFHYNHEKCLRAMIFALKETLRANLPELQPIEARKAA